MDTIFRSRLERSRKAVKNWWLVLLLGIAIFIVGVFVFRYPGVSYLAMAVTFGVLMLMAGVVNIVLAASTDSLAIGRGWLLAGGIIEVILGLILTFNPAVSVVTLPLFLGFWLMFRSFAMVGFGSDMRAARVSGAGWTIVLGVLLLICSIIIIAQPILYGIAAVVIWVGISMLIAGVATVAFSLQLRNVHKFFSSSWDSEGERI